MLSNTKDVILELLDSDEEIITKSLTVNAVLPSFFFFNLNFLQTVSMLELVNAIINERHDAFESAFIASITQFLNSLKTSEQMENDIINNELHIYLLALRTLQLYNNTELNLSDWFQNRKIQFLLANGIMNKNSGKIYFGFSS